MCKKCETNPVYEFTNKRKLCSSCFIRYFDKKFLYTNRKFNLIKSGDKLIIKGKEDKKKVLEYVLNKFKEKLRVNICSNGNKFVLIDNIDSNANEIINLLINKDIKDLKEISPFIKTRNKMIIKPFYLFTDQEIFLYAKLNKISLKNKKAKQKEFSVFLNEIEKNHPEAKRAVINSFLKIKD
jgi:tRNA(Ile)-lysidine synthase TilS/MesJ